MNWASSISDEVVERMERMADFPRRCPHGEPIPSAEGKMPRVRDAALNDADPGSDLVISRVNTHDMISWRIWANSA